jgi:hypothetical protein
MSGTTTHRSTTGTRRLWAGVATAAATLLAFGLLPIAIDNFGTLAVTRVAISNSEATSALDDGGFVEGGAIENFGTATVKTSLLTANTADYTGTASDTLVSGGAISNENEVTIDSTTMLASKASATGSGGGFVPDGGEVYGSAFVNWSDGSLSNSLVSGSRASVVADGSVNSAVENFFGTHRERTECSRRRHQQRRDGIGDADQHRRGAQPPRQLQSRHRHLHPVASPGVYGPYWLYAGTFAGAGAGASTAR